MCEPTSIVIGGAIVAGAVAKAYSDDQAAKAAKAAGNRNAILAENAASDALQRGEADAARVRMQDGALAGKQRAALGSSGVDVNQGSAARVQEDTAAITAIDVETVRNNAAREAWGLRTQGLNYRANAAAAGRAGQNAVTSDIIGGAASATSAVVGSLNSRGYFDSEPVPPGA